MFSVTPATDSRLNVNRGLGHRPGSEGLRSRHIHAAANLAHARAVGAEFGQRIGFRQNSLGRNQRGQTRQGSRPRTRCGSAYDSFRVDRYRDDGYRAAFMRRARKAGRELLEGARGGP